jgi:hypothetical protein
MSLMMSGSISVLSSSSLRSLQHTPPSLLCMEHLADRGSSTAGATESMAHMGALRVLEASRRGRGIEIAADSDVVLVVVLMMLQKSDVLISGARNGTRQSLGYARKASRILDRNVERQLQILVLSRATISLRNRIMTNARLLIG